MLVFSAHVQSFSSPVISVVAHCIHTSHDNAHAIMNGGIIQFGPSSPASLYIYRLPSLVFCMLFLLYLFTCTFFLYRRSKNGPGVHRNEWLIRRPKIRGHLSVWHTLVDLSTLVWAQIARIFFEDVGPATVPTLPFSPKKTLRQWSRMSRSSRKSGSTCRIQLLLHMGA